MNGDDMRMQEDAQEVRDGQRRQGRDANNLTGAQAIPDDEPALDGYAR